MLGKLLKYEFKSTSRVLLFLYIGLIAVSLLFGIVLRVNLNLDNLALIPFALTTTDGTNIFLTILTSALTIIYLLLIYAIFITTVVVIVMRFYKNMLGGEGYLMHTLPVKTGSLILSKIITSFCWMLIAGVVVVISTIVLGLSSGILIEIFKNVSLKEIISGIQHVLSLIGIRGWSIILSGLIGTISSIVMYYMSMAIGNLANNHKFLFSVLAYVGIQVVVSIVMSVSGVISGLNMSNSFYSGTAVSTFFNVNIWSSIILQLVIAVGGYFLTNYLLSKKLNLA